MNRREMNSEYFKETIWPHYKYVQKLLYTLTLDHILTEDLAQDTIIQCWKKIESLRDYKDIKAAISAIARNEYRQHLRRSKRRMEIPVDPEKLRWMVAVDNVEDCIRKDGDLHEFLLLFRDIKREYVQVVILADYYGFTMKEIAKLLHKNYNTVVSHHARGLEEMRKKKHLLGEFARRNA